MALSQIIEMVDTLPSVIHISIVALYLLVFLLIIISWLRSQEHTPQKNSKQVFVSIIIAARNEDKTLPFLLSDLEKQNYPSDLFEVILVDDHSVMKITDLPEVQRSAIQRLKIVRLPENVTGKKNALFMGVRESTSELLLFTDADCRAGCDWIASHVQLYTSKCLGLSIGLIDYHKPMNLVEYFARLEQIALTISGAGTALWGMPTLCNGANLSIKRNLYLEYIDEMKTDTPSGDDLFLLHAIKKQPDIRIDVLRSKSSVIYTSAPSSPRELLNQRVRWLSKAGKYSDAPTILLSLLVVVTNLALVSALFFSIFSTHHMDFTAVFIIKIIADSLLVGAGLNFFSGYKQLLFMPCFVVIYPFYMIIIIISTIFRGFTWKDRTSQALIQSA